MTVVPGDHNGIDQAFQFVEVHDHADRVEPRRPGRDLDPPVVAVEGFEGAVIQPELVGGSKEQ